MFRTHHFCTWNTIMIMRGLWVCWLKWVRRRRIVRVLDSFWMKIMVGLVIDLKFLKIFIENRMYVILLVLWRKKYWEISRLCLGISMLVINLWMICRILSRRLPNCTKMMILLRKKENWANLDSKNQITKLSRGWVFSSGDWSKEPKNNLKSSEAKNMRQLMMMDNTLGSQLTT